MNGIEKITARISADADQEITRLKAQAQQQADEILANSQAQADALTDEILKRGRKAAEERLERLQSAAQMETRKLKLAAKQEVLGETFELALKRLCDMPDDQYIRLLTKLAVEASLKATGDFYDVSINTGKKEEVTFINETGDEFIFETSSDGSLTCVLRKGKYILQTTDGIEEIVV